ncbi:MAG: hypothetical protein JNL96_12460 [Planctomycetaceae bacterium]|nr:hypothetical protein [Planctomycetaceae bacterium]
MKAMTSKVIDGLVYDTATAELIAEYEFGRCDSFDFVHVRLFKTQNGRFFLHGTGGANTEWRTWSSPQSCHEGQDIRTLTENEALAWCEDHKVSAEVIAEHFKVQQA